MCDHLRMVEVRRVTTLGSLSSNLPLYPLVGYLQPVSDGHRRRPTKSILDHGVVTVTSTHAHGARDVLEGQVLAFEGHGDGSELVHVDHLVRACHG